MKDSAKNDERVCLEQPFDFAGNTNWRIFRIMAEFVEGFEFLYQLRREVTIFGSAALPKTSQWYKEAVKLGRMLGGHGFTVITGGGPSIMEAANKGAVESGGESIGLDIELPTGQRKNEYVKKSLGFHYFFSRKVMLTASAQTYIFFPGGYGTLDEFFEMLVLIQTKKMEPVPVVCVGQEFWEPLDKWIKDTMLQKMGTIMPDDCEIYEIVDSAEEAFEIIKESKERKYF